MSNSHKKVYQKVQWFQMYFSPKALLSFDVELLVKKKQGASHELIYLIYKSNTKPVLHQELA